MGVIRRRFLSLAAAAAATPFALQLARPQVEVPSTSRGSHFVFPGAQWEAASLAELGWSIQGLAEAYQLFANLPPASMVVIDRGRIVVHSVYPARVPKRFLARVAYLAASSAIRSTG